jgi:hypothetical protein
MEGTEKVSPGFLAKRGETWEDELRRSFENLYRTLEILTLF